MENNIIQVKQLPIIVEQLHEVKAEVTEKVEQALSLVCTEDTVKDVKKVRSELNKELKDYEERRKAVKKSIMTPYEQFETVYKDCISETYKKADTELKGKIDSVENELKEQKKAEVKGYFDEYLTATGIDFVTFENAHINVTLSASMKSLKEQAKAFIDKIVDDLNLIDTQEHKDEILYEYKQSLNVSNAITTVANRYKAIEEAKAREEERKAREQAEAEATAKVESVVEAVTPPTVEPIAPPVEEEKTYTLKFTVRGTMPQLKAIKEFLNNGGYDYE
ncbi:DUF1351 domain-containing protein [uncultured Eubacterium sp.]|uniref:DUF1351 domain-containing protein n=1 Tax=uncultured Eubacterium sp. TaxID=165185 RepID=UPI0025E10EA6|nr:DUF1351 domain-containing protein [uncultured Eubacterium sp.]